VPALNACLAAEASAGAGHAGRLESREPEPPRHPTRLLSLSESSMVWRWRPTRAVGSRA